MIKSFKCRETEKLYGRVPSRKFPTDIHKTALRKLCWLDAVLRVDELKVPPGNRLEKLKGTRTGQYSIRINDQWRICFEWKSGDAFNVEIVDYHRG